MRIGKLSVFALILAGWMAIPTTALLAQNRGPATKPSDAAPKTYAEGVKKIQALMSSIDAAIKAGKIKETHPDAEAIITLSKSLGEWALASTSGVPKDKVKEVNQAAKDLAEMTDMFHDAADAGKADEAKGHYGHMTMLVETLGKYVPKQ